MPQTFKAIDLLVRRAVPVEFHDSIPTKYDKGGLEKLLSTVAEKNPGIYTGIAKKIADIGRNATWLRGDTIGLDDFEVPLDREAIYDKMEHEIADVEARQLSPLEEKHEINKIRLRYADDITKLSAEAAAQSGSGIYNSVVSGARGSKEQMRAMVATPAIYTDQNDNIIPVFVRRSFGEGLRPYEFVGGSFGARKSVVSTKAGTAQAGDKSKQLVQMAADQVVTIDDCGSTDGTPWSLDEKDVLGTVLARETGGFPAGTVLDNKVVSALGKQNIAKVVSRSPLTCNAPNGVCAKCLGANVRGEFKPIGYSAGVTSAQAIGEPLAQLSLNCLSEGTLVRMADLTTKCIEDIKVGDLVLGSDLHACTFPVRVTATWNQGVQDVYDWSFKRGSTQQTDTVTATENHVMLLIKSSSSLHNTLKYGHAHGPMQTTARKLKLSELSKLSFAVYPLRHLSSAEITSAVEEKVVLAFMTGWFTGDGIRYIEGGEVRISCADPELIEDVNRMLANLGLAMKKRTRSFDWACTSIKRTNKANQVKQHLRRLGLEGKYCHEKTIPSEVSEWSDSELAAYIAGYFASDGTVGYNKAGQAFVAFASTSRPLLEQLKLNLELRFRVYSGSISCTGHAGAGNGKHDSYSLYITRKDMITAFAGSIGPYVLGIKRGKINNLDLDYPDCTVGAYYKGKFSGKTNKRQVQCFDISVDHPDELFVLANGLIVKNSKHSSGMATTKKDISGLKAIDQFIQSPEAFPSKAAVATMDGTVERIHDAPQGGKYITVNGTDHYVLKDFDPLVKVNDTVEAGDILSEGLADPEDIVQYKGLGAGRMYWTKRFKQLMDDSGIPTSRRHTELLSRVALNHMRVTGNEPIGDALPDDVVSYNQISRQYTPAADATEYTVDKPALNTYLEKPVLHYTIGTRVTPKLVSELKELGVQTYTAAKRKPDMEPELVRARTASPTGKGWFENFFTSYIGRNLEDSAIRGKITDFGRNTHFIPRLAIGENYGKTVETTGEF